MFFKRNKQPESVRLYQSLRRMPLEALSVGIPTDRGTRVVAYSRGCGGGASFLIREERPDGACVAFAILATYESSGIERSSFASDVEAMAFAAAAVEALSRSR